MKLSSRLTRRVIVLSALIASSLVASAATVAWSEADFAVSTNWSDGLNWIGNAKPGVSDIAYFTNNTGTATSPGADNVDNIVNANFTIAGLTYSQTNGFHNTVINPGVTLTISNTTIAASLQCGTQTDAGGGVNPYSTISGAGGTLILNNTNVASALLVQQSSSVEDTHMATLDLSDLDTFNATIGRILVAVQGQLTAVSNQVTIPDIFYPQGTLLLAKTNLIQMKQVGTIEGGQDGGNGSGQGGAASLSGPAIVVGDASSVENTTVPDGVMELGQTNAIFTDTITIGRLKSAGTLKFNSVFFSTPAIYLRGASANRVSMFIVADDSHLSTSTTGASACNGTVDLSAGTADILIDTLMIASGQQGNGTAPVTGIFTLGAGTLNANTVDLGYQNNASAAAFTQGMLNVNGGNLVVNNQLVLGRSLGGSVVPTGTLNVNEGTVTVVTNGILDQSGNAGSTITLANSIVSAPNIGTPSAPIGTIAIGDSTLNIAVGGLAAPVVAVNLMTDSGSIGNTINVTSISPIAGLATTITLIQSANAIQGNFNGNLDFVLGTLPSGYAGYLTNNASSTAVQLVLTSSPFVANTWTGADLAGHHDTNWSDGLNWSTGVAPGTNSPAFFNTTGTAAMSALSTPGGGPGAILPAKINNIVDGNFAILDLSYANTNGTYHNTSISSNATLNVTLGGLTVGSPDTDLGNTSGNVTISGTTGTLTISNTSSQIYVGLGDSSTTPTAQATLDMSGLGEFHATVANLLVGVGGYTSGLTSVLQPVGIVYLAQTNNLTVSSSSSGSSDFSPVALEVGDAGDAETAAGYQNSLPSALYLGQSNAIFADFISVGRQWGSGGIFFNPAFANSTVSIRGVSANAVSVWSIGDGAQNTLTTAGGFVATNDFTGGTINAVVNTLNIGKSSPNSTSATAVTGTLTFNAGIITANTVNVSDNPTNFAGSFLNYGVGTINVNGTGTLMANNALNLGFTPGAMAGGTPIATLNLTGGGAVWANNLVPGANGTVSTISMNGGSLAVSNTIGTAAVPLTTLNLTNATISLGPVSFPAINVGSLNVDAVGSATNTINISSLPAIEQYPLTFTIIQSANPINLVGGTFNFKAGLPAASPAYTGSMSASGDGKSVLLTLTGGPVNIRGNVFWNGPDSANINWSDPANWQLPPVPGVKDTAFFNNTGTSGGPGPGAGIDNVVDTNLTIAGLTFAETNSYHNTVINPGVTLTILNTNVGIPLLVGTQTDPGSTTFDYNTISGAGGTLVINNTNIGSAVVIQQCSGSSGTESHLGTLDLSGLDTFNATVGRLLIGVQGFTNTTGQVALPNITRPAGTLILAKTNVIHLTQLGNIQGPVDAANGNGSGSASIAGPALCMDDAFGTPTPNILQLGRTNAIFADTITVGREKSLTARFLFNSNLIAPALALRGASANRVAAFNVADDSHVSTSTTACDGTVDLSGGTSDVMVDTLAIARGEAGNGNATVSGTFTMGPGTLNANTVTVGATSAANAVGNVTGTLNVNTSGTLVVNNQLVLAQAFSGSPATHARGILNIGGTVSAAAILCGGGTTNSISLTNGTLSLTSVNGSIGTAAVPIGSITISNSTLNLAMGGASAPVVTSNLTTSGSANTINVTELPLIMSVPATNTLIQSVKPITGAYNFVLGTLPTGYSGNLQTNAGYTAIQLVVTSAPFPATRTRITSVSLQSGANLAIAGINGQLNGVYYVLTSTNLTLPLANWTIVATNTFNGSGNFSVTVPFLANDNQRYYSIKSQ